MLEALLNSKGAASLMGGLGKGIGDALGGGGPMVSGGTVDARSFMDGSGWTVSTGSSRATGGRSGGGTMAPAAASPFYGGGDSMQAGSPLLMLALGGLLLWQVAKH